MKVNEIAKDLTKTNRWVFLKDEKVSLKSFNTKGIVACFPSLVDKYRLYSLTMVQQFELTAAVLPKIKSKEDKSTTTETQEIIKGFLDSNIIFEDLGKAKEFHIYNIESRKVDIEMDANIILRRIPMERRQNILNNIRIAKLNYDAYDIAPSKASEVNGIPVTFLNLYSPPKWRQRFPVAEPTWNEPPKLFKQFLEYLVPDKKEQEEVISWMCWALVRRHQSYLMLRGNRGNGKTIFMKMLMGVIGDGYVALDGVSTSGFNADMKNKRVIGIDDDTEIGSREGYKLRKRMINTRTTFNEKHKQTTESEEQYASYIICSNPSDKFYVEHDERRVVQVTLVKSKLDELFKPSTINFIDELANDDESLKSEQLEFLAHLGHWLLGQAKKNKYSYTREYKGGTFWMDVVHSLGNFNRKAVEKVLSKEESEYKFSDLVYEWKTEKSNHKTVPHWNTFKTFLETFQYKDETIVESIDDKERSFRVIDRYCPEEFDDIDIDDI